MEYESRMWTSAGKFWISAFALRRLLWHSDAGTGSIETTYGLIGRLESVCEEILNGRVNGRARTGIIKAEIEEKDKFECTKKMDFLCIGPSTIVVASRGESKYNSPSWLLAAGMLSECVSRSRGVDTLMEG